MTVLDRAAVCVPKGTGYLIRDAACFWNTISGLSICHDDAWAASTTSLTLSAVMYAKARHNTVVQINSTITPP